MLVTKNGMPNSYVGDLNSEGGREPSFHEISADMNISEMQNEWIKIKSEIRGHTYRFRGVGANCTSAVARVLYSGMDLTRPECGSYKKLALHCFEKPGDMKGVDTKDNLKALVDCINEVKGKAFSCECSPYPSTVGKVYD